MNYRRFRYAVRRCNRPGRGRITQRGVGLIEVLVAILLLSVSLLGLARLQLESMQHQRMSYSSTMAQILALDMSERIRSNPDGLGAYAVASTQSRIKSASCSDGCGADQLAGQDLNDWQDALNTSTLTGIDASIGVAGDTVTLTVRWQDIQGGGVETQSYSFEVVDA